MSVTAPKISELDHFLDGLRKRNEGEPEFLQAVQELAESIMPWYLEHPEYDRAQILERLTEPDRIVVFRVCWEDDEGHVRANRGWRVQFNSSIGPYKGGLRFHPSVTQSVLKFLGFEQILKNALTGLPMGGAKGGSNFNPKGKSDREVMRFCQSFMTELSRHIGANIDIPAGDIGVGAREIGYLFGQHKRLTNEWSGTLTGKGLEYGGSVIRTEATGYGAVYFMEDMLAHRGDTIEGKTAVVSGSGNVAQFATEKLIELGGKVVTLSDSSGFIHDKDGIDHEKLEWVKNLKNVRRGRIAEYADQFPNATFHADERPWRVPAELALPCATQNEISENDAVTLIDNGLVALAEGANMPTELEAVHRMKEAGVLFGPAKAANAGGVAVSGLEQTQNAMRVMWSRDEVDERLKGIMKSIHAQCVEYGTTDGYVDYVRGANIAGFKRVANAMLAYGVT